MAIMEHAYYACFGYQVTSFYAASRYINFKIYYYYFVWQSYIISMIVLPFFIVTLKPMLIHWKNFKSF